VARLGCVALAASIAVGLAGCGGSSGSDSAPKIVVRSTTTAASGGQAACDTANRAAASLAAVDLTDRQGLAELPAAIAHLSDVVPDELRDDVAIVAEAVSRYVTVLQAHDFDAPAVEADPAAAAELHALDTPEFVESMGRIRSWLQESCGS
jgi:hypothetical protein